jgi:mono/diheme cytochrome c family protein
MPNPLRIVPSQAFIAAVAVCGALLPGLRAEDPIAQFEREVRPVLEENCIKCHGPEKQKGGLRLDQKTSMITGGESGAPAVRPGKSSDSPLIKLITSTDPDEFMPPKGDRLKAEQIAALRRWIANGAHLPSTTEAAPALEALPPSKTLTDQDRNFWSFKPVKRMDSALPISDGWSLQPIDHFICKKLHERGLVPSPEASRQVLIRRLSFDLTGLPPTPEEVRAFLEDTNPDAYDRVVERLLASPRFGERQASLWLPLARYAEDQAHQVGDDTKFFYPHAYKYRAWVVDAFNRDLPYDQFVKFQIAADKVSSASRDDLAALGFIGLGPKYYNRDKLAVQADEWEDRVDTVTRTMLGLTVACARCHDHKFDPILTRDYHALAGVFASTRMVNKTPDGTIDDKAKKASEMKPAVMHIVEDAEPKNLNVFIRGNVERKGPVVERGFIEVLGRGEPVAFTDGSGRRELAEAIASRENPLTARVFVNRIWGAFFGSHLVSTPSNFGHSGATPTHPELLDDLAARFMDGGWSIKALVREIVLSAAYRQASLTESSNAAIDPENTLLWRANRRRLSVEQWRDTVLFLGDDLEESPGAKSQELDSPANRQRTLYARISRLKLNDLLMMFDYPDANVHAEKRSVTTTPMQKLFVLNSPFMQRRAQAFASRVISSAEDDEIRVVRACQLAYARLPSPEEVTLALNFLRRPNASDMSRWEQYAQLLLASNELLYVD